MAGKQSKKQKRSPKHGAIWRLRKGAKIRWIRGKDGRLMAVVYGEIHVKA